MPDYRERLFEYWEILYPGVPCQILENFLQSIQVYADLAPSPYNPVYDWYKEAVVYSLYVDLFNADFEGLTEKLDYISDLGADCLWLLPVLDSPMRDGGFDISNYCSIRSDLTRGNPDDRNNIFRDFIAEAHRRNIKVIFDIAINHISDEHPWFSEARKSKDNPYRPYFIWSDNANGFSEARIIFKGIETSNWEPCGDQYYFHRFFSFQPDLNYRNPEVLFAMCRNLLYWKNIGIDGFRADAIPYLWKEEGTPCENHPITHIVVKFFRALLDYIKPGTLLLAEACQQPAKVVEYLGNGDECHAAYHFPLMPRIYKSIAMQSGIPLAEILSDKVTPLLPSDGQWFTFLRCHDELSLELVYVTEEERSYIHQNYCRKPEWDFRMGEGISARLSELMDRDPRKILLAYSLIFTLPGTPVIYYGDEFGKLNDEDYYHTMKKIAGKDDTRFLVRGKINWDLLEKSLAEPNSLSSKLFSKLRFMLKNRRQYPVFGRGNIKFSTGRFSGSAAILAYTREYLHQKVLIIQNLSETTHLIDLENYSPSLQEILHQPIGNHFSLEPFGFRWITTSE